MTREETRTTRLGRVKPAPRIEPTYGTAKSRKAARQRDALYRQQKHETAMKKWKESDNV